MAMAVLDSHLRVRDGRGDWSRACVVDAEAMPTITSGSATAPR